MFFNLKSNPLNMKSVPSIYTHTHTHTHTARPSLCICVYIRFMCMCAYMCVCLYNKIQQVAISLKKPEPVFHMKVYVIWHHWRMALTIHVSAKVSDYKNSAYSLPPFMRIFTVTVIENRHLSFPSHKQASKSGWEVGKVSFPSFFNIAYVGSSHFCPSRIKAFFSCPQDLKFPVGFAHSLLVNCAVPKAGLLPASRPRPGQSGQQSLVQRWEYSPIQANQCESSTFNYNFWKEAQLASVASKKDYKPWIASDPATLWEESTQEQNQHKAI